jgi:hypothetical protein
MPPVPMAQRYPGGDGVDYWGSVTSVPCPACEQGTLRWAEAAFVQGYRICDTCHRHFVTDSWEKRPVLLRAGARRTSLKKIYCEGYRP